MISDGARGVKQVQLFKQPSLSAAAARRQIVSKSAGILSFLFETLNALITVCFLHINNE